MPFDVDEVVRNASGLIRRLENPMNGVYALLGLITLRLENRHFDLDYWPEEAKWEKIREDSGEKGPIQDAVSALVQEERTEEIGRSLKDLGLVGPSGLMAAHASGKADVLSDLIHFVDRIGVTKFPPHKLSRLSDKLLFVGGDMNRSGEFFTPASLSALIADLLDPEPGDSIYDPTVGSGSLLLSVQRRGRQGEGNVPQIHGQEINPGIAAVARINARLHGVQADIRVGNTLTDPKHVGGGSLQTFDLVVANPPMGLEEKESEEISETVPDRFRFGPVAPRQLDSAFLQHAISSVGESGKAAVVVPPRLLSAYRTDREVIEGLITEDIIEAVIQLPEGILPNTSIPPALFVFNRSKPKEREGRILLVDASEEHEGRGLDVEIRKHHREKIAGITNHRSEEESFSIDVETEDILSNGCNLKPSRYILDRDITGLLGGSVEWTELQEIAAIDSGHHVQTKEEGDVPVLSPADISRSGIGSEFRNHASSEEADGLPKIEPGDLVLSRLGRERRIAKASSDIEEVRCGQHAVRIRLDEKAREIGAFLADFLSSSVGQRLLRSRTIGSTGSLPSSDIRSLPVPVPGSDVADAVERAHEVESELASQIRKVGKLRDELFSLQGSQEDDSQPIRKLSATAEVLSSSLFRSDDLDYRIRNFYPFPLAYTYRNLQSVNEPVRQHEEILRIVENVVSFLACVGLSVGRYEDVIPSPSHPDLEEEALKNAWRGGIALGTWKTLAHSVAKQLRGPAETDLASNYSSIWFSGRGQSDFDARVDELVESRNDARHGRGPTTQAEYKDEVGRLHEHLQSIYEKIEFFVGYPLHFVRNLDSPWSSTGFEVESLTYVGDHPGMNPETSHIQQPASQNILYIESGSHEWIPLHPLISVHHCPECKRRETYVLDKWVGEKKFALKSFERGHGIEAGEATMDIGDHASVFFAGE